MTARERVLKSLNFEVPDRPPLDGWFLFSVVEKLKKHYNVETDEDVFLASREYVKNLLKSFIFLRKNIDRVSENESLELAKILSECNYKIEKIVRRIKDKKI